MKKYRSQKTEFRSQNEKTEMSLRRSETTEAISIRLPHPDKSELTMTERDGFPHIRSNDKCRGLIHQAQSSHTLQLVYCILIGKLVNWSIGQLLYCF